MKNDTDISASPSEELRGIAVIIPSLNPCEHLTETVRQMHAAGFDSIILIDDGSTEETKKYFAEARELTGATLLTHEVNRGKGAALKTAFTYILESCPDIVGAVTVDGDGQHTAHDAVACARKLARHIREHDAAESHGENAGRVPLVIGVRDFSRDDVPARSAFGNRTTALLFRLFFNLRVTDTQTGLRAVSRANMEVFRRLRGERYEYETNMLLECKRFGIAIEEIPIETVYIDDNSESHFNPFIDSLRIYALILKFMFSSMAATAIDYTLFMLLFTLFVSLSDKYPFFASNIPYIGTQTEVLLATVLARIVSSLCNFALNSHLVFSCGRARLQTLVRYYTVAIPQMLISALLVSLISQFTQRGGIVVAIAKIIVDIMLFLISFRIQRGWVFSEKNRSAGRIKSSGPKKRKQAS